MTPKELRQMAEDVQAKKLKERPLELKDDLMSRMKERASLGGFSLDFAFHDSKEIVEETIRLLQEEGFKISLSRARAGIIRFEW